jgi:rare lipoprotein A
LRTQPNLRARPRPTAALGLALTIIALPTAAASAANDGGASPTASPAHRKANAADLQTTAKKFNVVKGGEAALRGHYAPGTGGRTVSLEINLGGEWVTRDTATTDADGDYRLAYTPKRTGGYATRVAIGGAAQDVGRLDVFRKARATWYGEGLYGNKLACGGTLTETTIGVANKTLPCGTKITLRYKGRELRVKVIDRGPFSDSLDYDLTSATKEKLGYPDVGTVLATR